MGMGSTLASPPVPALTCCLAFPATPAPQSSSLIFLGRLIPAWVLPPQVGAIASSRRHQQRLQLLCVQLGDQRSFQGRALQLLNEDLGIGQGLPAAPGSVVREGAPSQARGPYVELMCVCARKKRFGIPTLSAGIQSCPREGKRVPERCRWRPQDPFGPFFARAPQRLSETEELALSAALRLPCALRVSGAMGWAPGPSSRSDKV